MPMSEPIWKRVQREVGIFAKSRGRDLPQGLFLATLFNVREHALSRKSTMRMTFAECVAWSIAFVRDDGFPDFWPRLAN